MVLLRLLSAALVLVAGAAAAAEFGRGAGSGPVIEFDRVIESDAGPRRILIEAPAHLDAPAPAVMVLHGAGGSIGRVRMYTRFSLSERGWVEIYPNALDGDWSDGRLDREGRVLRPQDDVSFLTGVIGTLAREGLIDPARVYVTGPSNGGMMTLALLCARPGLAAGAAPVIASQPVGLECSRAAPTPVLFIHGDEDPLIPIEGGPVAPGLIRDRGAVLSARASLEFWAEVNGCRGAKARLTPDRDPDDGARVTLTEWTGCAAETRWYVAAGAGHTWPGRADLLLIRALFGPTTRDIDATEEIERFFLEQDAAR